MVALTAGAWNGSCVDGTGTGDGYRTVAAAAFEAAVLVRSTGVCGGGRARAYASARAKAAAVTEFSRREAAERLVDLLSGAGREVSLDTYTAGNRHRYEISRVSMDGSTDRGLQIAWRLGFAELCGRPERHPTPARRQHVLRLAAAAWRAALLATGPTRSDSPGLRVGDLEIATALVRAARVLDVPVRMNTRPGGQLLLVLPVGQARVRLEQLTRQPDLIAA